MTQVGPRAKTQIELSDGRSLTYYDDTSGADRSAEDLRGLTELTNYSQLRFDPLQEEWVIVASHRQDRTHLPPTSECPLCPSTIENPTEIPAADYDVVVFDNRFPSLTSSQVGSVDGDLIKTVSSHGRCEVICFSSDHDASYALLSDERLMTIADSIVDRTRVLSALPGVEYVLVFENRGAEVGVTLHHPHGQIYAYPFIPTKAQRALDAAVRYREARGDCLFCAVADAELEDGRRILAETDDFVVYVPSASRWPYEAHIQPRRHVADIGDLGGDERLELLRLHAHTIRAFDGLFGEEVPYLSSFFQAPVNEARDVAHLRIEVASPRRAKGKLKYLATSESAAGAYINDVVPEDAAGRLREAWSAERRNDR